MRSRSQQALRSPLGFVLAFAVLALALAPAAFANPVPGFVEHWTTGTSGWGGGDNYSNPGTGGVLGGGDGYLLFSTPGPSPFFTMNLGANTTGPNYNGDWIAAGIAKVELWLNDVGATNAMEIHFSLGTTSNLWQYDTGFIPAAGTWTKFTVDLTGGPTGWTQIINSDTPPGTFTGALQTVDKILIRHDLAPYSQTPNTITADVGLDELTLVGSGSTGVPPAAPRGPRGVALAAPWPNPSRSVVALDFESFDASPVRVEIVDASGRIVRHALAASAAGRHRWSWDGRIDAGGVAAAGIYRARVWNALGGQSRSFAWLGGGAR